MKSELPILLSAIIISAVSTGMGVIVYQINTSWALPTSLGFGISGFLLVILPNILFLRKLLQDDKQPSRHGVEHE